jgi:hypothetical protein
MSAKIVLTFADSGCRLVSATDPHGRILSFLDWSSLWSSGQSFWLQIQRSRIRFPTLPDFLRIGGSGTGCNPIRNKVMEGKLKAIFTTGREGP